MKAIVAVLTLVAALLPAAAGAKGLATVRVCGPDRCATVDDRAIATRVSSPQETVDPPGTAPYYRLDIAFDAGEATSSYSTLFVPDEGLIASNAGGLLWYVPRTDALRALMAASRELEPYGAPRSWPRYVQTPDPGWVSSDTAGDGRSWGRAGLAAAAVLLALVLAAAFARRTRLPRPSRA